MDKLVNTLNEIAETNYKVTLAKNGTENIHQTQRNGIGAQLKQALYESLSELLVDGNDPNTLGVFFTSEGVIVEVPNSSIADNVTNEEGSGAISLLFSVQVKSLNYNAADSSESYQVEVAEKMAKKLAAEEKKKTKIAKDSAARAKKNEGR